MAVVKRKRSLGGSGGFGGGSSKTSPLRPRATAKTPPCQHACPNDTQIRDILTTIMFTEAHGRTYEESFEKAWHIFTDKNPMPAVLGRVCPHPCETGCNRQHVDSSLSINCIERFIGDFGLRKELKLKKLTEDTKSEKIAVIGAGPAGLSCAYQLARRGYKVTIFEAFSKSGGMLRYGIPAYRLPRDIIDAEVKKITDLGVEIKYNTSIGNDIPFDTLKKDYKAVFVGLGAHEGWTLGVEGEDAKNVYTGTTFLNKVNSGEKLDLGKSVYVIGGGDTAIDAARVSKRLGADAKILYRRTRKEMPAIDEEIEEAIKEGIPVELLATPISIIKSGDRAIGMRCIKMELGEPDASGRRRPVPIEGSEYEIKCDTIVTAISQQPVIKGFESLTNERGKVSVDEKFKTKQEAVYAGGDLIKLSLVTIALAEGRKAAAGIENYINNISKDEDSPILVLTHDKMRLDHYEKIDRNMPKLLAIEERFKGLNVEVNLGLTEDQIKAEAKRCMSCGHCFGCEKCWMYCQDSAIAKSARKGDPYTYKLDLCTGCKKCAEECPCGFLEMT